ncbi:MAG: acylphosphatase [Chloroflexota bacterium]
METFRAIVNGRVQGVNFRHDSMVRARELGLKGYARNMRSGDDVEVVAQGRRDQLEQFLDFLRTGPSAAHVTTVDVQWGMGSDEGPFDSFTVRR